MFHVSRWLIRVTRSFLPRSVTWLAASLLGVTLGVSPAAAQATASASAVQTEAQTGTVAAVPTMRSGSGYSTNRFFDDLKKRRVAAVTLDSLGNASVSFMPCQTSGGCDYSDNGGRARTLVVPPDGATLGRIRAAGVPLRIVPGGSAFGWSGRRCHWC